MLDKYQHMETVFRDMIDIVRRSNYRLENERMLLDVIDNIFDIVNQNVPTLILKCINNIFEQIVCSILDHIFCCRLHELCWRELYNPVHIDLGRFGNVLYHLRYTLRSTL